MRVVVTGAAGFIGSRLASYLANRGHKVLAIDKEYRQFLHENISTAWADVAERSWMETADEFKPDAVFHLAASFANEKSVDHPEWDARDNVLGTVQVGHYCVSRDVPVIYTGSSSSYGTMRGAAFKENDPLNPSTPYALSKYTGEKYLTVLGCKGMIFRLFNVFGPGDPPGPYRNAIPNMFAKAKADGVIPLYGESSSRDFTPIDVVLEYLYRALKAHHLHSQMYTVNCCIGRELPMKLVAQRISKYTGATVEVLPSRGWDKVPNRAGDPTRLYSLLDRIEVSDEAYDSAFVTTLHWLDGVAGSDL